MIAHSSVQWDATSRIVTKLSTLVNPKPIAYLESSISKFLFHSLRLQIVRIMATVDLAVHRIALFYKRIQVFPRVQTYKRIRLTTRV